MSRRASPLDNEQCRQCTSFSDYVKQNKKKFGAKTESDTKADDKSMPPHTNCPLDKDQLGQQTWGLLHTIAATYPEKPSSENQKDIKEFFNILSRLYPCKHCAADLREDLKAKPPKTETNESLSQWLCQLHNKVNKKLGKPIFDCSLVNERWRDGWKDGSCDI